MALKYAILGYLSSAPGSGYDLAQQLDGALGWFWSASHSQIYPELRRLETAHLIEGTPTTVGDRMEKRVYSITPEGQSQLHAWASGPLQNRPNRDPERLQLVFSDDADIDSIRRHLSAHRDHYVRRMERLLATRDQIVNGRHERIEERLAGLSENRRSLSLALRDMAYSGDIRRAEVEISWATDALSRIDLLAKRRVL